MPFYIWSLYHKYFVNIGLIHRLLLLVHIHLQWKREKVNIVQLHTYIKEIFVRDIPKKHREYRSYCGTVNISYITANASGFRQLQQSFLQCLEDSTFSHPRAFLRNKSDSLLKRVRRPSAVIPENIQPKRSTTMKTNTL